jgi:predicted Zn finger-like uncharacterized protein
MTRGVKCPQCGAAFVLHEQLRGKSIRCSKCPTVFRVPALASADDVKKQPPQELQAVGAALGAYSPPPLPGGTPAREPKARGVPLRVVVSVAAFIFGIALAGAGVYLSLESSDGQTVAEISPANPSDGPVGPKQVGRARREEQHASERVPDATVTQSRPEPKLSRPVSPRPTVPPVARPNVQVLENREKGLALPSIAGWVMLSDGVTLIVALPDEAKLAYIDTLASKELKRVALPFKPDRLAVQGKHLCASVQGTGTVHILDRDSGADRKELTVQGTIVDMACHPAKGVLHVATFNPASGMIYRIFAIDAAKGTVTLAGNLASARQEKRLNPQAVGPARVYSVTTLSMAGGGQVLAIDPNTADALYVASASHGVRWGRDLYDITLTKYAIAGRVELNRVPPTWDQGIAHNPGLLPIGPFWPVKSMGPKLYRPTGPVGKQVVHVSSDSKNVAILGGGDQIDVFSTGDINSQAGVVNCPGVSDFDFHPVLGMVAVEGENGNALYFFNSKSLAQTNRIPLGARGLADSPPAGRLLTFGARGTKLLYYDRLRGGFLRSFPLSLSAADLQALAKAYHAGVRPFEIPGAIEGESMKILGTSGNVAITPQEMSTFLGTGGPWSNGSQLFAKGVKAGDWTDLELPAPAEGKYHVVVYLTCSWDYGIVQFYVNGAKLGQPIDGFHNDTVITTGPIDLGEAELKKGANTLRIEVIGSNPNTRPPHYSWGLDCLKLNRLP